MIYLIYLIHTIRVLKCGTKQFSVYKKNKIMIKDLAFRNPFVIVTELYMQ